MHDLWLQDESDVTQTVIFLHWKHLRHQNLSKRCRSTMRSRQVGVKTVDVPLFPSWTAPGPKALKRVTCVRKKTAQVSSCAVNCLAFILETVCNVTELSPTHLHFWFYLASSILSLLIFEGVSISKVYCTKPLFSSQAIVKNLC